MVSPRDATARQRAAGKRIRQRGDKGGAGGAALEGRLRITPVFTWAEVAGFEAHAGLTPDKGKKCAARPTGTRKLPVYTLAAACKRVCTQGSDMLRHSKTCPPPSPRHNTPTSQ